ncbi:MAG: hypothetical protein H6767_09510 [Candidatus Peribacteria bacterium]|nr:MAG: hypothetical protein H6767_09510 [Candidatus Peribacteria bacterium]
MKFLSNGTQAWKKTTASNSVLFDTAGGYGIKTRNGVNSAFEDYGETCEEGVSYTASTAFSALASMQVENVGTYTAQSHNHSFSTVSDYSPYISQGAADFSCSTPPLTSETWCEQAPTTPTIWLAWTNTNPVLVYGQNATDPNPGDTVTYYWSTSAGSLSSTTTTGSNGVQITFPSGHPTFTVSVYAKDQKGYTSATTTATYAWVSSGFYSNQQVLSSWECMFGYKTG